MTDDAEDSDRDDVLTLQDLIRVRRDERGWSYSDLERRADHQVKKNRWQQLGSGYRIKEFPEPASIEAMAQALEVDVTTVVLASAQSIGLNARRHGPALAHLLPAGTDLMTDGMRDAILTLIRSAVSDAVQRGAGEEDSQPDLGISITRSYEWPKKDTSQRRNAARGIGDGSA